MIASLSHFLLDVNKSERSRYPLPRLWHHPDTILLHPLDEQLLSPGLWLPGVAPIVISGAYLRHLIGRAPSPATLWLADNTQPSCSFLSSKQLHSGKILFPLKSLNWINIFRKIIKVSSASSLFLLFLQMKQWAVITISWCHCSSKIRDNGRISRQTGSCNGRSICVSLLSSLLSDTNNDAERQ